MHIYAPMWQTPDRHTESERRRHFLNVCVCVCVLGVYIILPDATVGDTVKF